MYLKKLISGLLLSSLLCAGVAFALPPSGTYPGATVNKSTTSKMGGFLRGNSRMLRMIRGVILESKAVFRNMDGQIIAPSDVKILAIEFDGEKEFCLQIASDPCSQFWLEEDNLLALARFVMSEETAAFTLPSDGDTSAITSGVGSFMVPVGDNYERNDWIHKDLDNQFFARVFRYVDFSDPYSFVNPTADLETSAEIKAIENAEHGFEGGAPENGTIVDKTYVNADFHSEFVAYVYEGGVVCEGVPARFHWTLYDEYDYAYLRMVEFAAPDVSEIGKDHFELYQNAQTVFCTAAILRALEGKLSFVTQ